MNRQTTTRLALPLIARVRWMFRWIDPWAVAAGAVIALFVLAALVQRPAAPRPPAAAIAPTPTIGIAVPSPAADAAIMVAADARPRLARDVVAYDAPDGRVIGPVRAGQGYSVIARSGAAWVQVRLAADNTPWVRVADLAGVAAAAVPDLATAVPTAAPLVIVAAPPVSAPPAAAAAPAPQPVELTTFAAPAAEAPQPAPQAPPPGWGDGGASGGTW